MVKPENPEWQYCSILVNQTGQLSSCSTAKKWAQKYGEESVDERTADENGEYNEHVTQSTANLLDPGQVRVTSLGQDLLKDHAQRDGICTDTHRGVWVEGVRPVLLPDSRKYSARPYHQINEVFLYVEKTSGFEMYKPRPTASSALIRLQRHDESI